MLHGPIKLAGIIVGFASAEMPVTAFWVDEGQTKTLRGGRVVDVGEPAFRLRATFGLDGLSAVDHAQLKGLVSRPFPVVLRSRAAGDLEDWPEMEVLVRLRSDIPETAPLYRRDAAGRVVWSFEMEVEAVETVEELPGAIEGGFAWLGTEEVEIPNAGTFPVHDIVPWGDATLAPSTIALDVDGTEMTLQVYEPGPSWLAALVIEEVGLYTYALDTTGTLRLGTPKQAELAV